MQAALRFSGELAERSEARGDKNMTACLGRSLRLWGVELGLPSQPKRAFNSRSLAGAEGAMFSSGLKGQNKIKWFFWARSGWGGG